MVEFDQIFVLEKIAAILREHGEYVSNKFVSKLVAEMGLRRHKRKPNLYSGIQIGFLISLLI